MVDNRFLIVVGLDIEGYTNREIKLQLSAQQKLEQWVIDSSATAKIASNPGSLLWVDTGDGGFLAFETSYQKAIPFLESFYSCLRVHNDEAKEESQIFVRSALHCDDVFYWEGKLGPKYAGNAINVCARILNGMDRAHRNQVVCSDAYLRKVLGNGPIVRELRLPDYCDKHGIEHRVWNLQKNPGFGIKPDEQDLYFDCKEWRLQD